MNNNLGHATPCPICKHGIVHIKQSLGGGHYIFMCIDCQRELKELILLKKGLK